MNDELSLETAIHLLTQIEARWASQVKKTQDAYWDRQALKHLRAALSNAKSAKRYGVRK